MSQQAHRPFLRSPAARSGLELTSSHPGLDSNSSAAQAGAAWQHGNMNCTQGCSQERRATCRRLEGLQGSTQQSMPCDASMRISRSLAPCSKPGRLQDGKHLLCTSKQRNSHCRWELALSTSWHVGHVPAAAPLTVKGRQLPDGTCRRNLQRQVLVDMPTAAVRAFACLHMTQPGRLRACCRGRVRALPPHTKYIWQRLPTRYDWYQGTCHP